MSPSVLTADFNESLQPGERRGGYLNRRGFSRFQSFLDICNLLNFLYRLTISHGLEMVR